MHQNGRKDVDVNIELNTYLSIRKDVDVNEQKKLIIITFRY
jgi:hypothetical protein